jgi:taurine dioxygenase
MGAPPHMPYQTIQVDPITPVIGAEISGVDICKPLGNQTYQEIHDALMAHQVIFFRDQVMTLDQHKAFGRHFGELHIHPTEPAPEGHPEIITIHADEKSKAVAGMKWHSDVSCEIEPPMGSILHMLTVPPSGGDTMFCSTYAAYESLSQPIKDMIQDMKAWHESRHVHRDRLGHKGQLRDGIDVYPESLHPIVRTHPVTGRKGLYVSENFTTRIEGLRRNESDAILKMLFDVIATPEFHCRFRWKPNSVAFWDNRSAQHRSVWDYYPAQRHGYRVTIAGDKPY